MINLNLCSVKKTLVNLNSVTLNSVGLNLFTLNSVRPNLANLNLWPNLTYAQPELGQTELDLGSTHISVAVF